MIRIVLMISMLLVSSLSMALSYTVEVTEKELQQKVSAMMPLEKKKYFITMIFTNPQLDLQEADNKIAITLDISVKAPGGIAGTGQASLSGGVDYNNKEAAFYLNNPVLHTLEIDNISKTLNKTIRDIAQLSLAKTLAKRPVYTLKDDNLKQKLAKSLLKAVKVEDEKLIIELSVF